MPTAVAATPELTHARKMAVMGAVLLGLFLAALDQTIVGTAMPRILTDLHGNDLYTWVVTAYLLASTITVPIYGKFSDTFGRKPMLMIGIGLFLLGSALSGLSQNVAELITFRALQGLGAGALFPIALAVIGDLFTPRERGKYQGLFGATFGISFILGPFLGGFLTDNLSWHWVFYVNLPIGLVAMAVIALVLPNVKRDAGAVRRLDYAGVVLFTAGVVPLLLGLTNKGLTDTQGNTNDWLSWSVGGLLVIAVVVLAVFVINESRAAEPILPLDLFRNRTYWGTMAATFLTAFSMFATIIFVPRYYQAVEGYSATKSGYMVWPLLVGLLGSSIGTGILISRIGSYKKIIVVSSFLLVVGSVLMTQLQLSTTNTVLWLWLLVVGLGVGPSMSAFTTVVQNLVTGARMGAATSTLTFLRQIGGSVGLAFAGTLFSSNFRSELPGRLAANGVPTRLGGRAFNGGSSNELTAVGNLGGSLRGHGVPETLVPRIVTGVREAFVLSVAHIFWLGVISSAFAFLIVLLVIRDVPLRGSPARVTEDREVPSPRQAAPLPVPAGVGAGATS
ncbi:MAG: MDR family MFS transporter [Candidatus Dormibacteria bacterium]